MTTRTISTVNISARIGDVGETTAFERDDQAILEFDGGIGWRVFVLEIDGNGVDVYETGGRQLGDVEYALKSAIDWLEREGYEIGFDH